MEKRRRLIVDRRFQFYFIALFFLLGVLLLMIDWFAYQLLLGRAIEASERAGVDPLAVRAFLGTTRQYLLAFVLFSIGVTALLAWFVGLIVSHKIAGPVYRTLQIIRQLVQKNPVVRPVRLRTMDCFPELELALDELAGFVQKDPPRQA